MRAEDDRRRGSSLHADPPPSPPQTIHHNRKSETASASLSFTFSISIFKVQKYLHEPIWSKLVSGRPVSTWGPPRAALMAACENLSTYVPADQFFGLTFFPPLTVAVLRGDSNVKGTVTFEQSSESSPTTITYDITGHDPSAQRGMHIHQFGDNTNGCTSAGPHCKFAPSRVEEMLHRLGRCSYTRPPTRVHPRKKK